MTTSIKFNHNLISIFSKKNIPGYSEWQSLLEASEHDKNFDILCIQAYQVFKQNAIKMGLGIVK